MTDTQNDFILAASNRAVAPLLPVRITTRQQAYRTAAWLEAMGEMLPDDGTGDTYDTVREAIRNT